MTEKKRELWKTMLGLVAFASIAGVILLAAGQGSYLRLETVAGRTLLSAGLFLLAIRYLDFENAAWRIGFGLFEIGAAMVSNWHQLSQLANKGLQSGVYERLAFIVGGIVLIEHGLSNLVRGAERVNRKRENKLGTGGQMTEKTKASIQ